MISHEKSLTSANGNTADVGDLPSRVLIALDHVKPDERDGVREVVAAFARGEVVGKRLPGQDAIFSLQAAPDLLVFVRREFGTPIQVLDIVRPAALRSFTDAAING